MQKLALSLKTNYSVKFVTLAANYAWHKMWGWEGAERRVELKYSVVQTQCSVGFQVTGNTVSHYLEVYV